MLFNVDSKVNTIILDRLKPVGKIVRCICLLNHPIPNTKDVASV